MTRRTPPNPSRSPRSSAKKSGDKKAGKPATAKSRRSWGRTLGRAVALAAIWGIVLLAGVIGWFAWDLPDISQVTQAERRPTITMLAADGTQFARYGDLHGRTVNAVELPPHLVQAVLATEDRRFYSHFGIDPAGLARAAWVNWQAGQVVQGGSTITQQLAKNLFLTPERTLKRKVQEALLALWLERTYSKNQILSAYLNRVYLGAGTYGIEAAAQTYFGKPATEVTLREAAVLAGLLKAPSRFSPLSNPGAAHQRAMVVLQAMLDAGFVTEAEVEQIRTAPPMPRRKPGGDGWRYVADFIAGQVIALLGPDHPDVTVRTTLDLPVQRSAERRVAGIMASQAAKAGVGQVAVVSLAPDGAVRALVGGADYHESQFNRAVDALRQPGSAFKPFVFLAAVEAGLGAESLVDDGPIRIGKWSPANFEPGWRGPVPLREALAQSINTAAVRLADRAGVERIREVARRLGIDHPIGADLSIALGTSETTLLDLTGAYAAFANGGRAVEPYAIAEIQGRDGGILYLHPNRPPVQAIAPRDLNEMARMMLTVVEYGTGKGARLDRMAAGKTGTSQDYRDAWFIGYTADLVTGVWMGNDDNTPMKRVTGGSLPARLWREIMTDAHERLPVRDLPGLYAPSPPGPAIVSAGGSGGQRPSAPNTGIPILDHIGRLLQGLTGGGNGPPPRHVFPTRADD